MMRGRSRRRTKWMLLRRVLFNTSCAVIVAAGFVFAGTLFSLVFREVIPATWPVLIISGVVTMLGILGFLATEGAEG